MKTISLDTTPKVEKIWIDLIRTKTNQEKYHQTCALSQSAISLSKRAIMRANPNSTQSQLDLLFVEYHYGLDLKVKLKNYLDANGK